MPWIFPTHEPAFPMTTLEGLEAEEAWAFLQMVKAGHDVATASQHENNFQAALKDFVRKLSTSSQSHS